MAKPCGFRYSQCDPCQQRCVRQVEQRLVEECGMKSLETGELWWPSLGSRSRVPKELSWGFRMPPGSPSYPSDRWPEPALRPERSRRSTKERLPRAAAKNHEGDSAGDQRAMEGKSAEANVDRFGRMNKKIISA